MIQNLKVAVQLYSVRDDMEKDFFGTLQKVKEMGYEGVEFAGLFGHSPKEVKEMLDKAGLTPISAHVPIDELLNDLPKVVGDYKEIGCQFIAIPWLDEERRPGFSRYEETLEQIQKISDEARRQGLTLLYHNHDFEFVKTESGEYALDVMYQSIPELVTELDTCWVNIGGEDPAEYIRKYAGRASVVHLKDFWLEGEKPKKMYELIGRDNEDAEEASGTFELRPVGYGMQDFPKILKACAGSRVDWIVVEQDFPSMGKTPLECIEMSVRYLDKLK